LKNLKIGIFGVINVVDDRFDLMLSAILNLNIPRKSLVLDVGCGAGHFCERMLNRGFNIVGLDLYVQLLKVAMSKLKNKNFSFAVFRRTTPAI
jgi:2-polyprenyl-3-methyl-5-hydroxy-6-metoxy-1,4-benzoquinol methylase